MKKLIAIMAVMAVMLSFAACGDENDSNSNTENTTASTAADTADGNENNNDDETPVTDNTEITEDDVRNHAETPASDFEYVDHGDNVSIKAYNGSDPIVVIPEQIDGKDVIGITDGPFTNDSFVKGISLPSTIKELDGTFGNNEALQVVLASGVETVGQATFNCNSSLKFVDLGDNLKEFTGNNYIQGTVEKFHIPAGVEDMSKVSFRGKDVVTIVGEAGSYAETYANGKGIKFEAE